MTTPVSQVEIIDTPDQVVSLDIIEDSLGEIIVLENGITQLVVLEAPGAQVTAVSDAIPLPLGVASAGTDLGASRADHVHAHGNQSGGSLHANATSGAAGFMPSADKAKLDASTSENTPNTLVIRDATGSAEFTDISLIGNANIDGSVIIDGDLTVNGTETILNTQTLEVEDKNIVLGKITVPTDISADGGGITLKGATDKTITWINSTDSWTFNQRIDLTTGNYFSINSTSVLSSTTLGPSVVNSSLTSVGFITSGDWDDGTY
jgi:hypothetical protein